MERRAKSGGQRAKIRAKSKDKGKEQTHRLVDSQTLRPETQMKN